MAEEEAAPDIVASEQDIDALKAITGAPKGLLDAFQRFRATAAAVAQARAVETYANGLAAHARSMNALAGTFRNWPGDAASIERKAAADALEGVIELARDVLDALVDEALTADDVMVKKRAMDKAHAEAGQAVIDALRASAPPPPPAPQRD